MDADLTAFVAGLGFIDDLTWTKLSGGVSCDAWRVADGGREICVKRALAKLNVTDEWRAPVGRTWHEYLWFETAREIWPDVAPQPLAVDDTLGLIAMAYLPDANHRLWKRDLLDGHVDPSVARAVGERLGAIHAATARRPELAAKFATDEAFFALRLEPYLLAAAVRRPLVAPALRVLVDLTASTHLALVHGDVSPKNILIGPTGPVFLDAETAWWGDPAFDLAFCLNHLLLKTLVVADRGPALSVSFAALAQAYLAKVDWEGAAGLEARAARLLPGLLLARVDGKSPAEYLTDPAHKAFIRAFAEPLLMSPPATLADLEETWRGALVAAKASTSL